MDSAELDDYEVPIARVDFKYGKNERKVVIELYQTAAIVKEAKAEILPYDPTFMSREESYVDDCGAGVAGDRLAGERDEAKRL